MGALISKHKKNKKLGFGDGTFYASIRSDCRSDRTAYLGLKPSRHQRRLLYTSSTRATNGSIDDEPAQYENDECLYETLPSNPPSRQHSFHRTEIVPNTHRHVSLRDPYNNLELESHGQFGESYEGGYMVYRGPHRSIEYVNQNWILKECGNPMSSTDQQEQNSETLSSEGLSFGTEDLTNTTLDSEGRSCNERFHPHSRFMNVAANRLTEDAESYNSSDFASPEEWITGSVGLTVPGQTGFHKEIDNVYHDLNDYANQPQTATCRYSQEDALEDGHQDLYRQQIPILPNRCHQSSQTDLRIPPHQFVDIEVRNRSHNRSDESQPELSRSRPFNNCGDFHMVDVIPSDVVDAQMISGEEDPPGQFLQDQFDPEQTATKHVTTELHSSQAQRSHANKRDWKTQEEDPRGRYTGLECVDETVPKTADNDLQIADLHTISTEPSDRTYSFLIQAYLPLIRETISVMEILPHITFLLANEFSEDEPRTDSVDKFILAVEKSAEEGKWVSVVNALKQAEYPYVVRLVTGETEKDYQKHRSLIKLFTPQIMDRISADLDGFMDVLYEKDVINYRDSQGVKCEKTRRGAIAASFSLVEMVPRRHPDWFERFIDTLGAFDMHDVIELLGC